jgi:hypothetical protein
VSDRSSEIRPSIGAGYFPSSCFVYAGISTHTLSSCGAMVRRKEREAI